MPRKLILDTDAGHDDVVAWSLIQASPELELLGVTTVFGNTRLERVQRNARHTAQVLGSSVPLLAGACGPLLRERIHAESAHGQSGLAGVSGLVPETATLEPRTAAQFIVEQVLAHPHAVTLVPIGPLTNLALALRLEPAIAPLIDEIALMGGSLTHGNFTPAAEFNILADPHAARIVFESGARIAMFGLDVTEQVMVMPEDLERVRTWTSRAGRFLSEVWTHSLESHAGWGYPGASMHDPCPVVFLLRPDLFEMQTMAVQIETTVGPNFGRTTGDLRGRTGLAPSARVAVRVNPRAVIALLLERLSTLP